MGNSHVILAFLLGAIIASYLQARISATDAPLGMSASSAIPTSQTPTSQETTEPSTPLTTTVSQEEPTSATQPSASQPASPTETSIFQSTSPTERPASSPLPSTLPPAVLTSSHTTATTNTDLGKEQATVNKAEICEENSKRLMLICFIIIGVLVFICVVLLLVTVVLASRMSHLKRRQPSKRLPRSNGDFLSGNSLWPLGLETLQRMSNETPAADPKTQGPGLERTSAGHEQFEEAGKKLAREISNRQKHREMPPKPQDNTLTKVEL